MQKTKETNVVKDLVKGGLAGGVVFIIITLLMCAVLLKTNLSHNTYLPFLMITSAVSGIISGFTAVRKRRENGLVNGLAASIVPAIIMLTVMSVAYKGFSIFEMIIASCCLFGGIIGGISAVNIKKKKKPIKKR